MVGHHIGCSILASSRVTCGNILHVTLMLVFHLYAQHMRYHIQWKPTLPPWLVGKGEKRVSEPQSQQGICCWAAVVMYLPMPLSQMAFLLTACMVHIAHKTEKSAELILYQAQTQLMEVVGQDMFVITFRSHSGSLVSGTTSCRSCAIFWTPLFLQAADAGVTDSRIKGKCYQGACSAAPDPHWTGDRQSEKCQNQVLEGGNGAGLGSTD